MVTARDHKTMVLFKAKTPSKKEKKMLSNEILN